MTADLEAAIRERIAGGGKAFVPYVTGGFPGVDVDLLRELEAAGADAIEVGLPFSDPVVDGGVIQEASRAALEAGAHVDDILAVIADASLSVPIAVMTYFNPVFSRGFEEFLGAAEKAGVAGTIVPDLPVDEAEEWRKASAAHSIATVFLAAPGTSRDRLSAIAAADQGFIYCVATYGVTGARATLEQTARSVVESLRPLTDKPLLVGVGIATVDQASEACGFADGVIVGSALMARLAEGGRDAAISLARGFRAAVPLHS